MAAELREPVLRLALQRPAVPVQGGLDLRHEESELSVLQVRRRLLGVHVQDQIHAESAVQVGDRRGIAERVRLLTLRKVFR